MVVSNTQETEARHGPELKDNLRHKMRPGLSWATVTSPCQRRGKEENREEAGRRDRGRGKQEKDYGYIGLKDILGTWKRRLSEIQTACLEGHCEPDGPPLTGPWSEAVSGFDPGALVPKLRLQPVNLVSLANSGTPDRFEEMLPLHNLHAGLPAMKLLLSLK